MHISDTHLVGSDSAEGWIDRVLGAPSVGSTTIRFGPGGVPLPGGRTHAEGVVEQRKARAEQDAAALAELKLARTAAGKRSMNPASDNLMTGAQEIAAAEGPGDEAGGFNTDWISGSFGAIGRGLGRLAGARGLGRLAATGSSRSLMGLAGEYAGPIGAAIGAYHLANTSAHADSAARLSQERVDTGDRFAAEDQAYKRYSERYSDQSGVFGDSWAWLTQHGAGNLFGVYSDSQRLNPYMSGGEALEGMRGIDQNRRQRMLDNSYRGINRGLTSEGYDITFARNTANPYAQAQTEANRANQQRLDKTQDEVKTLRDLNAPQSAIDALRVAKGSADKMAFAADLGAIETKNQRAVASQQMSAEVTHQGYTDAAGARSTAIRNHYQELINSDPKNAPTWVAMSKQALGDEQDLRQNNLDSGFLANQAGAMMVHAQVLQGQRLNYAARQQGFDAQSRSLDAEQKKAEYNLKGPELAQSQETFGIRRQEVANNKALDTQAFNDSLKYLADAAKSTGYALEGAAGQFKSSLTDIATARDKANDKEADPRVRALNNQVAKNEMQLRGQQEARRQYNQGLTTNEIEHQNAVMRLRNLGLDDEADRQAVQYNLKEQEDALNAGNFTPDDLKRRRAALEDSAQQQLEHISQVEGHRQASSEGSFMQAFDFSALNAAGMVNKPLNTGDSKTDAQLLTENKNIQDTINAADGQAGGGNSGQLVALLQQIAANTAKQFAAQ